MHGNQIDPAKSSLAPERRRLGEIRPNPVSGRATLSIESILAEPFTGERMAKREHQMPSVLKQDGDRPYWYIRYRVRIESGNEEIRKEGEVASDVLALPFFLL